MIHRWIHRRAVLAWLLLPWLALTLAAAGLAVLDVWGGDGVLGQDWRLRTRSEWLAPGLVDLAVLLAGAYAAGTGAWLLGVLLGGRPARRSCAVLGLLCAVGGVALGGLTGLAWHRPAALVLGLAAGVTGGFYAALTHRPRPRVQRRRVAQVLTRPTPLPPPAPPPPRPAPAGPATTVMRHDATTTQPADD